VRVGDNANGGFPAEILAARDWLDFGLSYWRPQLACGIDAFMLVNSHTIRLLFYTLFSPWLSHGLAMWLNLFVAGYFTYRLCRDCLRMDLPPSIFAGLSYTTVFNCSETLLNVLTFSMIPFYLWAIERSMVWQIWPRFVTAGGLGLLAGLLSMFTNFTLPFCLWMLVWFLLVRDKKTLTLLLSLFVFTAAAVIGSMPQLWPLWLNAPYAHRTLRLAFVPEETINLFLRLKLEYVLLFAGLWACRFADGPAKKLFYMAILVTICGQLLTFLLSPFSDHLGVLKGITYNHFSDAATFFVLIAGAYGLQMLASRWAGIRLSIGIESDSIQSTMLPGTTKLNPASVLALACCTIPVLVSAVNMHEIRVRIPSETYFWNFGNPQLLELATSRTSEPFRVATVGTDLIFTAPHGRSARNSIHPAYATVYGFETVDGYFSLVYDRYQRYWARVIEGTTIHDSYVRQNAAAWLKHLLLLYASPEMFSATTVCQRPFEFSRYYSLDLLSLANTRYLISLWPLLDPCLELVSSPTQAVTQMQEWGARSFWGKAIGYLKGEYPPRQLYIYENTTVLPRGFLVQNARVFETADALLDSLKHVPISDIGKSVFLESEYSPAVAGRPLGFTRSEVEFINYTPDRIALSVKTDGPGILVLTNNYSQFWKALVDSTPQTIFPVYHTFQGVVIEKGQHEVVFFYDPPYRRLWNLNEVASENG
jgi:hypothetical protein